MPVLHRIEVVEGPRRGDKAPIARRKPFVIGRGKQTFDMLDPQVSLAHAALEWRSDRFWIVDRGSANGTRVNGVEVGPEGTVLGDGDVIGVGESVLRFVEERRLLPQWVYWAALGLLLVSLPGFVQLVVDISLWDRMVPEIEAPNPVLGHGGTPLSATGDPLRVPLDRCFMQELATNGTDLSIRRVTDWDGDGVSEIWIGNREQERVYTFDANGRWLLLGELPKGCQNSTGAGFRDLNCGNSVYRFRHGVPLQPHGDRCAVGSDKGHYQQSALRGIFTWLREPGGQVGLPRPYEFGLRASHDMAAWLGERGIEEPIHFLVCEDMFPGMSAQALTASGRIVRVQPGCTNTIGLGGALMADYPSRPVAIAMTRTGHALLQEQLNVFLGGSRAGHFQNDVQRDWMRQVSAPPTVHTATFVHFAPSPAAPVRFFNPVPRENPRLQLARSQRIGGLAVPGARLATDWSWVGQSSLAVLRTDCGQLVQVDPQGWRCGPPCLGSTPFLKISQVNGPSWDIPYASPRSTTYFGEGIEISVDLVGGPGGYVRQVVAASVAVRDLQACGPTRPTFVGPEVKIRADTE